MKRTSVLLLLLLTGVWTVFAQEEESDADIQSFTESMEAHEGFFSFYWDKQTGKIWLEVDRFDQEFLYVNSLAAGVGSNDLGLDRGQLGQDRVVKFCPKWAQDFVGTRQL